MLHSSADSSDPRKGEVWPMTAAQRRRAERRAVTLLDREFEVSAVRRALGGHSFAVEAVREDERLYVRAFPQLAVADAMAGCLNMARTYLALAWQIADNPLEWQAQVERDRNGEPR
jgi:hypothetical protein